MTEIPVLSKRAVKFVMPSFTSYLCDTGFSTRPTIKTKYRDRVSVEVLPTKALFDCSCYLNGMPEFACNVRVHIKQTKLMFYMHFSSDQNYIAIPIYHPTVADNLLLRVDELIVTRRRT